MTNEEKVRLRIACPEEGYPESEALFLDEEDFYNWFKTVEVEL